MDDLQQGRGGNVHETDAEIRLMEPVLRVNRDDNAKRTLLNADIYIVGQILTFAEQ